MQDVIEQLAARDRDGELITAVRHTPAREAQWAPMPEWVRPELAAAYRDKGVERLYSHQAKAAEIVHSGGNAVVVTPTASGKTLCYNLPVLNAVLENPDTRALYLFPTKALAQDQLAELHDLGQRLDNRFGVFTYDGDTPSDARARYLPCKARSCSSNPMHTGILPHHPRWADLFANLKYVVLDEVHTYRGVFGSHMANVLRRLRRICAFYGSAPQFICTSATIANPRDLVEKLIEAPASLVPADADGSPRAEKHFLVYNPPITDPVLGLRRSYLLEAQRLAGEFLADDVQTAVFARTRNATEVLLMYVRDEASKRARPADGARLSRRLPAAGAARHRARPARRQRARGGGHQRARAGRRHRPAGRGDGRLPRHHRFAGAAGRPGRAARRNQRRGAGGLGRAARPIPRAEP